MKLNLGIRLRSAWRGLLMKRAAFDGAQQNRLLSDWLAQSVSADKEISRDLKVLRARARDLRRNDGFVKRIAQLWRANVIGNRGIRLQAQIRTKDGKLDKVTNRKIEKAFTRWAEDRNEVSASGKLDWVHFQQQVIDEVGVDGEVFIRILAGFDSKFGMALEFIDPDRLDEQYNRPADARNKINKISMGIEQNGWGRPVAYHILTAHPSDTVNERRVERVPADQIIHIYAPERATQSRGVSWLAPIMFDIKMLGAYFQAEVVAARVGAAKMGFFESSAESFVGTNGTETIPVQEKMEAQPGVLERLAPGVTFKAWSNDHPSTAFPEFVKAVLRRIASGVNAAYNLVANDLEGVSYSSIRQGELNGRDQWRLYQQFMVSYLNRAVYRAWVRMALLSGELKGPSYKPDDYYEVAWRPRGWLWVDPLRDIQAAVLSIQNRLAAPQGIVSEEGEDYEEIQEQRQEAREIDAQYEATAADTLETDWDKPTDPETGAKPMTTKKPAATLPASAAKAMILAAFPAIKPEAVEAMLKGLEGFKPAAPEPAAPEPAS